MKKMSAGLVLFVIVLMAVIFLASSYVLMALVNVVLGQYNAVPLEYTSAMAITALLWLFGGALVGSNKS